MPIATHTMPYLDNQNDTHYPPQGDAMDCSTAVRKAPPQLNLNICRCRNGCACACSRGGDEQREWQDNASRDQSDNVSVRSFYSIDTCASTANSVNGHEGVERQEYGNQDFDALRRGLLEAETLTDRLMDVERMQRRPSFLYTQDAGPRISRVASFGSMVVEPGSGFQSLDHSLDQSIILGTCIGVAEPGGLFSGMGGAFEENNFVRQPLPLAFEQQFCQNMQIGGERGR